MFEGRVAIGGALLAGIVALQLLLALHG